MEPTKEALKGLEQLLARYFWGSTHDKKKTHWIKWEQCCMPFEEGGLGLRRFSDIVKACGLKLWWRFREGNSLWAQYLARKYCAYSSPIQTPSSSRQSPVWRRISRERPTMHHHIKWVIGDGKLSFWDDIWVGDRPLREFCQEGENLTFRRIRDFWSNNEWDVDKLWRHLHAQGIDEETISAILEVPFDARGADVPRWDITEHGNFSIASAWELTRSRQPRFPVFKHIWNKGIIPSASIFLWRLISNRLPVDTKLQWRGINMASKCRCCKASNTETSSHLFISGEAAQKVWRYFADWFPRHTWPSPNITRIEDVLRTWWEEFPRAPSTHISFIIPCYILWFLWAERNSATFRETDFNPSNVIWMVNLQLRRLVMAKTLLPKHWSGCTPKLGFMARNTERRHPIVAKMIRWIPPDEPWLKINTDGAFDTVTRKAAGGGIIRNSNGQMIRAFSMPCKALSSLEAELLAVCQGAATAIREERPIWIEVDATEVVKIVQEGGHGPAAIRHTVAKVRAILRPITYKITHIAREGNKVADMLAEMGMREEEMKLYDVYSAPRRIRTLVEMDKRGYPNFRFTDRWT